MDNNELENQVDRSGRGVKSGLGFIFFSIFLLISSVLLVIFFIYTFFVPQNPLNPFPPDVQTETPSAQALQPTATPTNTPILPTATPKPFPEVIPTQESGVLFEVQEGTPYYLPHQSGCSHMYVAGSILDINGNPLPGITVRLSGDLDGFEDLTLDVVSGSALQYSNGGFEIQIGDIEPLDSQNGIFLQLFLEDGSSASPMVSLGTSSNCGRNMIYINFLQVRE
jgi:hypothetical protein